MRIKLDSYLFMYRTPYMYVIVYEIHNIRKITNTFKPFVYLVYLYINSYSPDINVTIATSGRIAHIIVLIYSLLYCNGICRMEHSHIYMYLSETNRYHSVKISRGYLFSMVSISVFI